MSSIAPVRLEVEDASDFDYRGEGAANVVLAYKGRKDGLVGKVLRLRKVTKKEDSQHLLDGKQPAIEQQHGNDSAAAESPTPPVLSEDERVIWRPWPSVAAASSRASVTVGFTRDVVAPLLGEAFVDPGILVALSEGFLAAVDQQIAQRRPAWRVAEGHLSLVAGEAALISDHSVFPNRAGAASTPHRSEGQDQEPLAKHGDEVEDTICVEIKPKCGFLPTSPAIAPANEVKRHVTRFEMHQHLKLAKGEVPSLSDYSPLALFSGKLSTIRSAVDSLFETPQNNLRVFRKGREIFGQPPRQQGVIGGGAESEAGRIEDSELRPSSDAEAANVGAEAAEGKAAKQGQKRQRPGSSTFNEALAGFFPADCTDSGDALKDVLSQVLFNSTALPSLLRAQQLDEFDIEGVIVAFNRFRTLLEASKAVSDLAEKGKPASMHKTSAGDSCQKHGSKRPGDSEDPIQEVNISELGPSHSKESSLPPSTSTSSSLSSLALLSVPSAALSSSSFSLSSSSCPLYSSTAPSATLEASSLSPLSLNLQTANLSSTLDRLKNASMEELTQVIRNFLIAAMAKDCGIMIAIRRMVSNDKDGTSTLDTSFPLKALGNLTQPDASLSVLRGAQPLTNVELSSRHEGGEGLESSMVRTEALAEGAALPAEEEEMKSIKIGGSAYEYKISFLDLDMKPLAKIPKYLQIDQSVVENYKRCRPDWESTI
eukprot:TRINITY_DN11626_c0_g1_i1.p1 TRINITY_DN11626_c0_g1~~TRINITY_DN11626_c0_g1_i1.p1  ORF type:complete len:710 (+),score=106.98 TRINITY_DN11626_c0_g1_i1:42-2171(+)